MLSIMRIVASGVSGPPDSSSPQLHGSPNAMMVACQCTYLLLGHSNSILLVLAELPSLRSLCKRTVYLLFDSLDGPSICKASSDQ